MNGPLHGVRVLDLTAIVLGPTATATLAELGADVIKVESPDGDSLRRAGPARHAGMGAPFLNLNRNKRSLAIDLRQDAGRAAFLALLRTVDVLTYNLRPASMARLGLGYEQVRALRPGIIYCGMYGYAEDGPYAGRPAYDDLIQGLAALPSLETGPDGTPRYLSVPVVDRVTALSAAFSVASALFQRERTGQGQAIEIPMFETMAAFMLDTHMGGLTFDPPAGPPGYQRLLAPERRPHRTRDGWLCLLCYTPQHWRAFFDLVGRSELKTDTRFADAEAIARHQSVLLPIVAVAMAQETSATWLERLAHAGIPAARLHTVESLVDDEHLRQTGFVTFREHPTEGRIRTLGTATRWAGGTPVAQRHAPRLGEHSREILAEAGLAADAIDRLIADGVVLEPATPV
ncbi:MAG: CaiB/BaiF CoA transferase family protein [Burkholderiales bacterium]